ncbi:MAG: sirohydrochlorin ferrochelatase [Candidatus Endobugula sp.]|jgi:sirohydrochlorin ferrochelatase
MKILLIVAHGSRRQKSNQEIALLAQKIDRVRPGDYDAVKFAFLELAEPSIETAMGNSFENGAREIVILPYFLSAGNHVAEDVPLAVEQTMEKWPQKTTTTLPHIGSMELMIELIVSACQHDIH